MTKLTNGAFVVRETGVVIKTRPIIVELHEHFLRFRPKGTRQVIQLDIEVAIAAAEKVAAREAGVKI